MSLLALSHSAQADDNDRLCRLCIELTFSNLLKTADDKNRLGHYSQPHHPSFRALEASVAVGCRLCTLFRHALLTEYAKFCDWSIVEVEAYHRDLDDNDPDGKFVFAIELTYVHVENWSTDPNRYDGLVYTRHTRPPDDPEERLSMWKTTDVPQAALAKKSGLHRHSQDLRPWLGLIAANQRHSWVTGRQVTLEPNIELCLEWIRTCSNEHSICPAAYDNALPTRVIDLSGSMGSNVRLDITSGRAGKYIALSHCWGNAKSLRTLTTNLEQHLQCIPLDSLPLTFQHAVFATRRLGYRYLWIDSLCIIQDSSEDWQSECSLMQDVYSNAAVVIAGPGAGSSTAGFYFPRPPPALPPCYLPKNGGEDDDDRILVTLSPLSTASDRSPHREPNSPLSSRGWILQERLLAPRVLYFGTQQLYFECNAKMYFESIWQPINSGQAENHIDPKPILNFDRKDARERYLIWYSIVQIYSSCDLTHSSDRLPALSGLARRCAGLMNDRYLAGLWEEHLLYSLQWLVKKPVTQPRAAVYRAPSWSWACVDQPTIYDPLFTLNYLSGEHEYHPLIRVLHAHATKAGLDPYGQVSGADIVLEGPLIQFSTRQQADRTYAVVDGHSIANFLPDYNDGVNITTHQAAPISLLPLLHCTTRRAYKFCGLAVERVESADVLDESGTANDDETESATSVGAPETYRRIGLVYAAQMKYCADQTCRLTEAEHTLPWAGQPERRLRLI
ncbi:hypothetical protein LTR86_003376 [Recurvomyces mirabilis]|nr:hypothetical protein LTR86_003376 [Recurvomyces mirabilis]